MQAGRGGEGKCGRTRPPNRPNSEFQKIVADEVPLYVTNTLPYHTVFSSKVGNAPLGIWASSSPMDLVYVKE